MSRVIVLSKIAALVALLLFANSLQADEVEPEPESAYMTESETDPEPESEPESEAESEPESEPEPALDPDDDYARNGFYLGGDLTGAWYTEVKDDVEDGLVSLGYAAKIDVESPLGLGMHAGYRFHPHLAAEVQFRWFADSDAEISTDGKTKRDAYKFNALDLTGDIKVYLLTGRVQPFLLGGVGWMHFNADDKIGLGLQTSGDSFIGNFGGGVDLCINRNFVVAVQGGYVLPTGSLHWLDHVTWTVGLQYRF